MGSEGCMEDLSWIAETLARDVDEVVPVWQGDINTVYRVGPTEGVMAYLKVGPRLAPERDRLLWLERVLPVPRVLAFRGGDPEALLLSPLRGLPLSADEWRARPEEVTRLMGEALRSLHTVDAAGCPFGQPGPNHVLIHGDACLPNFLADRHGLTGYIDLGEACLAPPEIDLAAALWSLQYNLGAGYASAFLAAYGKRLSDEQIERLRRSYEDGSRGGDSPIK